MVAIRTPCQILNAHAAWWGASPAMAMIVPLTSDAKGGIFGERSSNALNPFHSPPGKIPKARP